jgi:hypothetical protein
MPYNRHWRWIIYPLKRGCPDDTVGDANLLVQERIPVTDWGTNVLAIAFGERIGWMLDPGQFACLPRPNMGVFNQAHSSFTGASQWKQKPSTPRSCRPPESFQVTLLEATLRCR